jgi:hypothetical protein
MTIPEIKTAYAATVQHYLSALDRYTDEQFSAQPADREWSLGQMYEHLYTSTTYFFLANTKRCLEKRKGQEGGEMTDGGRNIFKHNSFPPVKIKMPEVLRGPEPVAKDRATYKALFEEILKGGLQLADALPQDDGTYKTYHPVFGWLNAREWFQAGEIHARHHYRQQQEREEWLGVATA